MNDLEIPNKLRLALINKALLLFCFLSISLLNAQSLQKDIAFVLKHRPHQQVFDIKNESPPNPINIDDHTSELKIFFAGLIRGYQIAISSQDTPTCNFYPSCSRFSSLALQRAGTVRGILLTSDRLQRCNGLPGMRHHYKFDPNERKFYDPIDHYVKIPSSESTNE